MALLLRKLSIGVPIQRIPNNVRDSATGTEIKRVHLLEKKDLYNIRTEIFYKTS